MIPIHFLSLFGQIFHGMNEWIRIIIIIIIIIIIVVVGNGGFTHQHWFKQWMGLTRLDMPFVQFFDIGNRIQHTTAIFIRTSIIMVTFRTLS